MNRCLDLLLAGVALILCGPLLLFVAVLIKVGDGGPALFRQERIGRNFRVFNLLKLRTMCINAEKFGGQVTVDGDARVTRIGHWLRKTKIDELPQLWNVLRGDMSFVGPRPEVSEYVDLYREEYKEVLSVRPGLTDISSVVFRDESKVLARAADPMREYTEVILPQTIRLSTEYIRKRTTFSDIWLLWQTAVAIFFPQHGLRLRETGEVRGRS